MPVVTLSRQLGSLGDEIGQDVAAAMSLNVVDRMIVGAVAQRMGAPERVIQDIEDKSPTFVKRVADAIIQAFADGSGLSPLIGVAPPPVVTAEVQRQGGAVTFDPNDALYLGFVREVVREVAQAGNVVIIGRAGHLLLKDLPHALHVLVIAPMDLRVRRLMVERSWSREEAEKAASDSDHGRESYTARFYHSRWSEPMHYSLTVNTGFLSRRQAADIIVAAAQSV